MNNETRHEKDMAGRKHGIIRTFLSRNKFIFAAFAMPVLLVLMAFAATGIYPFGENQIAVIDMYHQYVPFLSELQYKLQEGGSLFYTWNGAGGSNFWNLLAYYGASPLNLLLALFPKNFVMEGITVILLMKLGLAGSFMAMYLRYAGRRCDMVTAAFATLYAMSAFVMAYFWCIMWMDAVALLPLCILGLNRIIDDGRAVLYTVSLALVVFSNYYMAIMVCIFILFYYPVLYFIKIKGGSARLCARVTGKAVGYSLLAIAMAAVMLLPTYISMQNTYYIASEMPDNWLFYNDPLDVLNQLLPNAQLAFRDGLPNLYCGSIVVILLVFYFLSENIVLREKLLNMGFLVFLFFSLNVNKLDFLWHGFHFPNQLPYRYTFVICFLLIGMAYRAFLRIREMKVKTVWGILAGGIGYYLIAQKLMEKHLDSANLFFYAGVAWLALYCAVLLLYKKGYLRRSSLALLMVVLIAAEMGANACASFEVVGNTNRDEYYENSKDIYKLAEQSKEEFVRTEMDYTYILNCPAMYHYRGLSQFSSSINANATALMEKIGLDGEPGRNRYNYNQTNPVTNAMLNVKYIITKNLPLRDPDFMLVDKSGYSRLYESKYPLSIGYMADDAIRTWSTESTSPFEVLDDYVRAVTGNRHDKVFHSIGEPVTTKNGKKTTLQYTSEATRKYYVFIEASNADVITVNKGSRIDTIDIRNDCGSIVNIGTIEAGKSFKLIVEHGKGDIGEITSRVCYLDQAVWDAAYGILSESLLTVTDSGDTYLEGTVEAKEAGVLVTSVPYEKGWSLEVDGQPREITELTGGLFISAALEEGNHEIRLVFRPPGIVAGAAISGAAILLLAGLQLVRRFRMKRLRELV